MLNLASWFYITVCTYHKQPIDTIDRQKPIGDIKSHSRDGPRILVILLTFLEEIEIGDHLNFHGL